MTNVLDYLKWRGDISFDLDGPNEIDGLIFCELTYLPFEKFISSCEEEETLKSLYKKFNSLPEKDKKIGAIFPEKEIIELFSLVASCQRYKGVKVRRFVNHVCKAAEKQFCAMSFVVNKEYVYVAFRGTDDTLVGWKEDFNMAFNNPIPSQKASAEYLDEVGYHTRRKMIVGGHSKGGNLAVYASLLSSDKTQEKIAYVQNFDGPGFRNDVFDEINRSQVAEKITNILPVGSVIGMIFHHVGKTVFIKSKGKGMYQHDGFNWEVMQKNFVPVDGPLKSSVEIHEIIETITSQMTKEERVELVEAIYTLVTVNEASTLTDITKGKLKFISGVLKADGKSKKVLLSAISKILKEKYKKKTKKVKK